MNERAHVPLQAELVLDARAELGEAPHWDAPRAELVWVDILPGVVHRFDPARGTDLAFEVGQPVGAAVPRASGGLVLALRDGIAATDGVDGQLRWIARVEDDNARTRMNDAACDAAGRLWAGTMDLEEAEPLGCLYRLSPSGQPAAVLPEVTVSNGLGWSPDGRTLYYIDSARMALEAFDFEPAAGTISRRRTVCEIERDAGEPDGLTVDADGGIWVALWGGWSLRRYLPDGQLVAIVSVPAERVTSAAFGGEQLETLYITTARPERPDPRQPHAGGIFAARPGMRGLPSHSFGG
jgi:sugar lactone lactonase YvrE